MGEYLPYLQDIAFQFHVAETALPGMRLVPYLVLADKSARASVAIHVVEITGVTRAAQGMANNAAVVN